VDEKNGSVVSIPSSSGHFFGQQCRLWQLIPLAKFQSPLQRGMSSGTTPSHVSIPSSSGHFFGLIGWLTNVQPH
jgi:hypothetical protein